MKNLRPHLVLIKPQPPRTEADCEAEALRFLRSWKRACERLAIQRNDAKPTEVTQPKPKRSHSATAA